jgi:DNA-binding transcriptional LysR family regulator
MHNQDSYMKGPDMTLVQLRHLIALADHGSFSKAAELCFVTQPALSRSIRALEDELGQRLVDRVGRRVELSAQGRSTLERARQIVGDADDLLHQHPRSTAAASATSLRIGLGSGPGALLMNSLLLQAVALHPRLRLDIVRGNDGLVQALRERSLDALVMDLRTIRPATDLRTDLVHEMRGAFMVRPEHPLARRRGALRFDELLAYPMASTPLSDEVARLLVETYGPQALPERCVTLRCTELSSVIELARHCDAVLLAIRAAAPQLVELQLAPPMAIAARLGLVTLARRTEPPGLEAVRALIAQCLGGG